MPTGRSSLEPASAAILSKENQHSRYLAYTSYPAVNTAYILFYWIRESLGPYNPSERPFILNYIRYSSALPDCCLITED